MAKVDPERAFSDFLHHSEDEVYSWYNLLDGYDKAFVLKAINPDQYQYLYDQYKADNLHICERCMDYFTDVDDLFNKDGFFYCHDCLDSEIDPEDQDITQPIEVDKDE